jgi:hypothetical protein
VLKQEKGKLVSASADCPRKTITPSFGGEFLLIASALDEDGNPETKWRNNNTKEIISNAERLAAGGWTVYAQFRMLCPAFFK